MYALIIKDRFFCAGYAFNQLIGVEGSLSEATKWAETFVMENPQFKHHSIMVEEIFIDDVSRIGLKLVRNS